MHLSAQTLFYTVALANCVFFGLLVVAIPKGNRPANRWLAGFFGVVSLVLIELLFEYSNFLFAYPHWSEVLTAASFLLGPLYYFYARTLVQPSTGSLRSVLPHWLPFVIRLIVYIPFYQQTADAKRAYLKAIVDGEPSPYAWIDNLAIVQFLIYLVFVVALLQQHQKRATNLYSASLAQVNLAWLKRLTFGLGLVWLLWANFHTYDLVWLKQLTPVAFLVILFTLGFYAIRQQSIFPNNLAMTPSNQSESTVEEPVAAPLTKAGPSRLANVAIEPLKVQLLQLMKEEHLYRHSELTLPDVATRLGVSTHVVSELLNRELGQSFFDFVNDYRLVEVKQLLADPRNDHFTLLALAYEAGFSSKTTFNTYFKGKTGLTPSAYRRQKRG